MYQFVMAGVADAAAEEAAAAAEAATAAAAEDAAAAWAEMESALAGVAAG